MGVNRVVERKDQEMNIMNEAHIIRSASIDITNNCNFRCRHCFNFSGEHNRKNVENIENYEELLRKYNFFDRYKELLDDNILVTESVISGGERKKISIIRMLLDTNSSVLVLDEPLDFLDMSTRKTFIDDLLKLKKDKIIIVVSHDAGFKEIVDYNIYL